MSNSEEMKKWLNAGAINLALRYMIEQMIKRPITPKEQEEIEQSFNACPPLEVVKTCGYENAMDGSWNYLGERLLPEIMPYVSVPHRHPINFFEQMKEYEAGKPISPEVNFCTITMEPAYYLNVWIGICHETKQMFWGRFHFEK